MKSIFSASMVTLILAGTLIMAFDVQPARTEPSSLDWTMFGYDLRHTGFSPSSAPETPILVWKFTSTSMDSSPAVARAEATYRRLDS